MTTRISVLAVVLLVSGCRKEASPHSQVTTPAVAASTPESEEDGPATPWLEAARQKAAGASVVLVWNGASLVARTPEGQVLSELPAVRSDMLDLDLVKDLLWVRDGKRLLVFDLRSPTPRAELIATAPTDVREFVVSSTHGVDDRGASSWTCNDPHFTLNWTKTAPTIDAPGGSIVGTAWLAANWNRHRNEVPEVTGFDAEQNFEMVRLPDTDGCDDDPRVCGRAHRFGATHWMLVLAATHYSTCHGDRCLLFDPRTKKYSPPQGPYRWTAFANADAGSCGPYRFDKSEKWYVSGHAICRTDGSCEEVSGRVLDWADPGPQAGSAG